MKVRILAAARADLDDIFLNIAADRPMAAERVIDRLLQAVAALSDFPEMGRPAPRGRRELVSVPPYVVIYRIAQDEVRIERVLHGARRR